MKELLIIAVGSALVNNVVLSQFLGICPFLGVSKKIETAAGMGGAQLFSLSRLHPLLPVRSTSSSYIRQDLSICRPSYLSWLSQHSFSL